MVEFIKYVYDDDYSLGQLFLNIDGKQVVFPKGSIKPTVPQVVGQLMCMSERWQLSKNIRDQYKKHIVYQIEDVINTNLIPNVCMKCKGCL